MDQENTKSLIVRAEESLAKDVAELSACQLRLNSLAKDIAELSAGQLRLNSLVKVCERIELDLTNADGTRKLVIPLSELLGTLDARAVIIGKIREEFPLISKSQEGHLS